MAAKIFLSLLLLAITLLRSTYCFQIADCSGDGASATLKSTSVSNCPDNSGPRCVFYKGENSTLRASFTANKSFGKADISIYAIIGPLQQKFAFRGPTDACGNYGFNCPTTEQQLYNLEFTLPVPKYSPSISAQVKFLMLDEKKEKIICFEFPVSISSR